MTPPQPAEVEIRVAEDGSPTPLRFRQGETWLDIAQVGRSWSDEAGDHWQVMAAYPPQWFDLIRTAGGGWLAGPSGPSLA